MPRKNPLIRISLAGAVLLGGMLLAAPRPAAAQATITVDPGLAQSYRSESWLPVRVTLTNQGAPARVEVRARFFAMGQGVQEYRIPPRELPSGANELHTLYMKSPRTYGSQPITVDFYRDGRVINTVRPNLRPVSDDAWLIYGIGPAQNTAPLNLLSTATMPPRSQSFQRVPPPNQRSTPATVAVSEASAAPDRWQGLEAVDAVVLAGVSERDFRPEQLAAIRDYAVAGGTVVVTGGLNWNRLDTPFFREMLPVRVNRSATASSLVGSSFGVPPGGAFPISTATPRPDSQILFGTERQPMVVSGRKGSGRVLFVAFDPSLPPFRDWSETRSVWATLLEQRVPGTLIGTVTGNEASYDEYGVPPGYYGGGGQGRLADAPFAIPQLDIPAFYVVALFLLSYVVILVPVNYFFLKARDKKEYAWITTPIIVALFSVGAYLIGYAFKGGNTLAVKVGLVEARADQTAAPFLFYTGLFSPRKTGYDVQFAAATPQQDAFSNALFSEPESSRSRAGLLLSMEDQPKVEDFAVDMWAMRVLKSEGVAQIGQGVQSQVQVRGNRAQGSVRNGTPFHLEDCVIVAGSEVAPVGDLAPGGTTQVSLTNGAVGAPGALLPATVASRIQGNSQQARMRRAVLEALGGGGSYPSYPGRAQPASVPSAVRLIGWIREPVGKLQVDGKAPREVAETLLVVHFK